MITHDVYIRKQLHKTLQSVYHDCTDVLILDELSCCQGAARIDIAVISDRLHGFEIKSELDTLERLRLQETAYNSVFNTVTLVTTDHHLDEAYASVEEWWGLWEAVDVGDHIEFIHHRHPQQNPQRNAVHLASLIWKDEIIGILKDHGLSNIRSSATRYDLWLQLIEIVSIDELAKLVGKTLRTRDNWRVVESQSLNGGLHRRGSKSPHSRTKPVRSRNPLYIGHPS